MKQLSPPRFFTLYGAVVLMAGLIGAISSGSTISLVTGAIFGLLAMLVGYGLGKQTVWAIPLGYGVSSFLGLFFMWRVVQGSPFPALAIAGLSLIAIAMLMQAKSQKGS